MKESNPVGGRTHVCGVRGEKSERRCIHIYGGCGGASAGPRFWLHV